MSLNEFIMRTFRTKNEYKIKKKTMFCFSMFIFYTCILNVFFFVRKFCRPKKYLIFVFVFLFVECYRLPIEFIIFWWDHGWNKLTFTFFMISKTQEHFDHCVGSCRIFGNVPWKVSRKWLLRGELSTFGVMYTWPKSNSKNL